VPQTSPFASRPAADRCPGVLRLTEAADGFLARVRLPGGLVSGAQLRVLARLADRLGDGRVELTSRGNLQLRGLAPAAAGALTSELTEAGLLPSLTHDRVRNVLASPLAGLDGGDDLTGLVRALDAALCARPHLAELSGRFLFAIDDGRGDVAGPGADVPPADVVAAPRGGAAVVNGLSVPVPEDTARTTDTRDEVVAAMLACAEAFLDLRRESGSTAWRIADLPAGPARVRDAVAARLGLFPADHPVTGQSPANQAGVDGTGVVGTGVVGTGVDRDGADGDGDGDGAGALARPVGLVGLREAGGGGESAASVRENYAVSAVLLAPLGRLTSAQLTWIAERVADREARVTPWRSVVLPRLADAAGVLREAAGLGFGTDDQSRWLRVTACAGKPGCASALADVQADAAGFADRWPGRLVHVSGCARHCGRPAATEIDVTATSEGYQVAGV
jgi:precorrin-3B synthase